MKLSDKHLRIIRNIGREQIAEGKLGGARNHEAMHGVDAGPRLLDTLLKNRLVEWFHTEARERRWLDAIESSDSGYDLLRMTPKGRKTLRKLGTPETWKTVPGNRVRHIWKADCTCDPQEVQVTPDFYEENGEPSCGQCGRVYSYVRTEILQ